MFALCANNKLSRMSGIILSIGYVQEDNRLARDDCSFTTHHCLSSVKIPSAMAIYCSAFFDAQILNVRIADLHQRINTKLFYRKTFANDSKRTWPINRHESKRTSHFRLIKMFGPTTSAALRDKKPRASCPGF
jgi:hypothetical protein